uniref:Uncharacterized protein n=1 Tax=Panagrellus redivivus TaxID=6233 RepID=A0A7E4W6T8_PANRE
MIKEVYEERRSKKEHRLNIKIGYGITHTWLSPLLNEASRHDKIYLAVTFFQISLYSHFKGYKALTP